MSKLRQLRDDKELTLKEVANHVNVDQSNLSRIERGDQYPSVKTAKSLASFYDISVGDVYESIPSSDQDAA